MRNYLLTLSVLLFFICDVSAQQSKYYRIKLFTNEKGLKRLSALGVAIDHGETKKGYWFISDFSENELSIIKQSKLPYKILISDVASYYANRNKTVEAIMPLATCAPYATPVNFKTGTMGGYYKYNESYNCRNMSFEYPPAISLRFYNL